jgi:hypothetical protein
LLDFFKESQILLEVAPTNGKTNEIDKHDAKDYGITSNEIAIGIRRGTLK